VKIYAEVPVPMRTAVATRCDGCGIVDTDDPGPPFSEVVISVGEHEDGGKTDTYDYCSDCLTERSPRLAAAGSTAPIVTGTWEP
jgi:hypothetical protein